MMPERRSADTSGRASAGEMHLRYGQRSPPAQDTTLDPDSSTNRTRGHVPTVRGDGADCAALDRSLNDKGYIQPGLGDAGDRKFGTGRSD